MTVGPAWWRRVGRCAGCGRMTDRSAPFRLCAECLRFHVFGACAALDRISAYVSALNRALDSASGRAP